MTNGIVEVFDNLGNKSYIESIFLVSKRDFHTGIKKGDLVELSKVDIFSGYIVVQLIDGSLFGWVDSDSFVPLLAFRDRVGYC